MSETTVSRRGRGEDAIYFATAKNRYVGSVSLGYGPDGKRIRRKVFGKTKQEVRDRLKALHQELNAGIKSSRTYSVREAVEDWLHEGAGRHLGADPHSLRGPAEPDRRPAAA
jgi:integrase